MPDKLIEIPGVGRVAFPESMTPEQINTAAAKLYAEANPKHPPAAKEHSWIDTAVDWLPAVEGAVGGIVGGIGGTVGGFGVGGVPGAIGGATVGGAMGEAHKQLINRFRGRPAPSTPTGAATDIALQGGVQGGTEAVGGLATKGAVRAGSALMQSAVKPGVKATTQALLKGVAPENLPVVGTLLKEGVNVTRGGIAKLDRIIKATNDEIRDVISNLPGKIDPAKVATRVDDVLATVGNQVDESADVAAATAVRDRFLARRGGTPLTPMQAQELKSGTYRSLKEKAYGEMKGPEIEANKALARGLKEEIEAEVNKTGAGIRGQLGLPVGVDLAKLNAREGAAIVTKEAIAKRIAAAGNMDPGSLAWLASNHTAGMLYVLAKAPAVKSLLARGLYGPASKASGVPENVLRVLVTSVLQSEDEPQETPQ